MKKGFTLIELIVVIVILVILGSVVVVAINKSKKKETTKEKCLSRAEYMPTAELPAVCLKYLTN